MLDVKDFGAVGDGTTDDAPAIQAAIDAATDNTVVLPEPPLAYAVEVPLVISKPLRFVGIGNYPRIRGRKLGNIGSNQCVLEIDGTLMSGGASVQVSNIALEQDTEFPTAESLLRINNLAESVFRNIKVKEGKYGVHIIGDNNTYGNLYDNIRCGPEIEEDGVRFENCKGGQHTFIGGSFTGGLYGLHITGATQGTSSVNFYGTNFEGCGESAVYVDVKDAVGLGFFGCRTEGTVEEEAYDWVFAPPAPSGTPATGGYIRGVTVQGCYFGTENADHALVFTNANGGVVAGCSVTGCVAEGYAETMVLCESDGGQGSLICANTLAGTPKIVNTVQAGVLCINNIDENGDFVDNQQWNPPIAAAALSGPAAENLEEVTELCNEIRAGLIAIGMAKPAP